jgi:hypothetical protein
MTASAPSRSVGTQLAYAEQARRLARRCHAELGMDAGERITPAQLVAWLTSRKAGWAPATWRVYKAVVVAVLDAASTRQEERRLARPDEAAQAEATLARLSDLRDTLRQESQAGCLATTTRTSAVKAKRLPPGDRGEIARRLSTGRARDAGSLNDYLVSAIRTGFRPCEWPSATRVPCSEHGVLVLRVANAKIGATRAHGPHRTLRFVALPEADRAAISRWLEIVGACEGEAYDGMLGRISDLLYRTTRALWPRRKLYPTLYTQRHEFSAMAKLVYERAEVAAMRGHATDLTASIHYGRCRGGTGRLTPELSAAIACLPQPDPEEVLRVRRYFADRLARIPAAQRGLRR